MTNLFPCAPGMLFAGKATYYFTV